MLIKESGFGKNFGGVKKMNHKGTVMLETNRLRLRRFELDDAEAIFNNWASDEKVAQYLTWKAHENIAVTKKVLSEWGNSYQNKEYYRWGIVVKETNELIGSIGVEGNKENRLICEIGFYIGREYLGKGYVAEALNRIIEFLFTETKCNRIEIVHDVANVNSGKVIRKCNFKFEGILRDRGLSNELELIDLAMYSLLKREWR